MNNYDKFFKQKFRSRQAARREKALMKIKQNQILFHEKKIKIVHKSVRFESLNVTENNHNISIDLNYSHFFFLLLF